MTATAEPLAVALADVVLPTAVRSGERLQAGIPQIVFMGPFLSSTMVIPSSTSDVHPDGSPLLKMQPVRGASREQPRVYSSADGFDELRRRVGN